MITISNLPVTPRVLVVEDDADLCEMFKLMLERKGFSVSIGKNADLVFNMTRNGCIDLVIMGMNLHAIHGMSGPDMCKKLKSDHQTFNIPVLMTSSLKDADVTCKAAGADEFLPKPFDIKDVFHAINQLLEPAHQPQGI